jgi:hypothetical protein
VNNLEAPEDILEVPVDNLNDQVQDSDVPDLIDLPVVIKASEALKKSHRLEVEYGGPPLTDKQFNLLDSDKHLSLGIAINQRLAESGLHAPRGLSKIQVNGEPVYCYFDATGKARAILPKGSDDRATEFDVTTWDVNVSLDEFDVNRSITSKISGKHTPVPDAAALNNIFVSSVLTMICTSLGLTDEEASPIIDSPLRDDALRKLLQPLENSGRLIVQFKIEGMPWVADMALRPGKKLSRMDASSFENDVSMVLSRLDAPLPQGPITTSQLIDLAPQGAFNKKAFVKISAKYSHVRTTADNAYVKKFYEVSPNKFDFFEHLLANEALSPGISNRMLVGVPTADKTKSIGPSGPMTTLNSASLSHARFEEFKTATITAVDDLFTLCQEGFIPPESSNQHYLLDPTAEKLEIKMIDFGIGKYTDMKKNKDLFQKAVITLVEQINLCLQQKSSRKDLLSTDVSALIAEVEAYAAKRAGEIRYTNSEHSI